MKNAMKKLTSLLLVALLLVGMIPFAASATEAACTIAVDCPHTGVQHDPLCPKTCDKSANCPHTGVHHAPDCWSIACDLSYNCPHKGQLHDPNCASIPCTGDVNCPHKSVYHSPECAIVKKQNATPDTTPDPEPTPDPAPDANVPTTNGVTCTNSYDCKHVGNLHVKGCPMIPCTNADTCDHGGWNHLPTCPKASTGCNLSANCAATLHAPGCQKAANTTPSTGNGQTTQTQPTTETYTVTFRDVNNQFIREAKVAKNGYISSDVLTLASGGAGSLSGHTFSGWYLGTVAYSNAQLQQIPVVGNITLTAYFAPNANKLNNYQVYLHIYKNNMIGSPDKQLNITTGLALDGVVTLNEVKSLVMNYYGANNSYGIGFDGLYPGYGDWALSYITNQKYSELSVKEADRTSDVVIKVMITNAYTKGSAKADSSNPKTGDSIYTAMTVMGVSAVALASVMYFYNKKRMAM